MYRTVFCCRGCAGGDCRKCSALEIEVNKGALTSEAALAEANQYIGEITTDQAVLFRLGMVLIPVAALIVSYVILRKKYHINEEAYKRLINAHGNA